jgi:YVTN family beta-propeller protein
LYSFANLFCDLLSDRAPEDEGKSNVMILFGGRTLLADLVRVGSSCSCAHGQEERARGGTPVKISNSTIRNITPMTLVLLFLVLLCEAASAGPVRIYVTNSAGDSVDVIDSATNKIVQVISGIEVPHGVNFSPDGKRVYVSNESERVLDVVDQKTGKVIQKVPLSGHPNNIAVTKDGRLVVICIAQAPGALDVVDTSSMKVMKSVPVKGPLHNVYITADQKYAVAGSVAGKRLTVIDLKTLEPAWDLQFDAGVRPMALETAPDGSTSRIFVQLSDLHGFAVVDFVKHQEVARVKLPDGHFGREEGRMGTPSHGIGVAPDGKSLWVNSVLANAVFEYSLPRRTLSGRCKS